MIKLLKYIFSVIEQSTKDKVVKAFSNVCSGKSA